MAKNPLFPAPSPGIQPIPMHQAMANRYLAYAISTIKARSLPDGRDGLKPVHRRILWAMRELRLNPRDNPKKCARVVGDVIGKYHPHGDASVYEALVRQAQNFSLRYPLIDGQGNFGNIDGDGAAAMRYTESRLTAFGEAMMDGLDNDAVDFRPTYDNEQNEPIVMPASFPNILANGSSGIAVGMATSIPSFNLGELSAVLLLLLRDRDRGHGRDLTDQILALMPGPDFATGGVMIEPAAQVRQAYRTGRGGFSLRARWAVEERTRGQWTVVVSEIPYGVKKGALIEQLTSLLDEKKLMDIEDIQDESDEQVRIRITPRARNVRPEVMMERLFQQSNLQVRFPLNLNVLNNRREPVVQSIQAVLTAYLDHRRDVLVRVLTYRLTEIIARLEILAAKQIVYLNLDAVIALIRTEDDPKPRLIERFGLSERQAEYVLDTRLGSLRRIDEVELQREQTALGEEKQGIEAVLASKDLQDRRLADQVKGFAKRFERDPIWPRRTAVEAAPTVDLTIPVESVAKEPVTVICSRAGWVKVTKGHITAQDKLVFKEGDALGSLLHAYNTDRVTFVLSNGRTYTQPVSQMSMKGHGDPLRITFQIDESQASIVAVVGYQPDQQVLLTSTDGYGFRIQSDDLLSTRKGGRLVMPLAEGAELRALIPISPEMDMIAMTSARGRLLCFPLNEIPVSAKARGVRLDKGGHYIDLIGFTAKNGLTVVDAAGRHRPIDGWPRWQGRRDSAGLLPPKGFPRSLMFVAG